MPADGTQLAELPEVKWFASISAENTDNVVGALLSLTLSELAGGRARLAIARIDGQRAISNGPNIGPAAQPQVWFGEEPASFFWRGQPLQNRRRRAADGANDRAAFDKAAILQAHTLGRDQGDPRVEHYIHTGFFHLPPRELA